MVRLAAQMHPVEFDFAYQAPQFAVTQTPRSCYELLRAGANMSGEEDTFNRTRGNFPGDVAFQGVRFMIQARDGVTS
jgi:hypothetical protein